MPRYRVSGLLVSQGMDNANKISAVVITLNESTNIERCLSSLHDVADEILVLDSGSADGTKEKAQALGANVVDTEWKGYSATKNHGHSLARYDYVISLDADEELDPELIKAVLEVKQNGLTHAYRMNRKNFLSQQWIRHSGWYPDRKVRLFHRDQASWKGDFVHEELTVNHDVQIVDLKGHMNHYTAATGEQHIATVRKYARLNAERYVREGRSYTLFRSLLQAIASWVRSYVLRMGFLDGLAGWYIAIRSARGRIWRYRYFKELQKNNG